MLRWLMIALWGISIASCGKQAPQLPSNKGNEIDTAVVSMLAINKNLAKQADSVLSTYAHRLDSSFLKSELGFWYRIDKQTKAQHVTDKSSVTFSYVLKNLDGVLLDEGEQIIVIGKKEIIRGLEEGFLLLREGEKATFIIPWHLGYGLSGLDTIVPAYTNLVYHIHILAKK